MSATSEGNPPPTFVWILLRLRCYKVTPCIAIFFFFLTNGSLISSPAEVQSDLKRREAPCSPPPVLSGCTETLQSDVCDSSVQTTAHRTDNKDSIWIMLLISLGTGPFSVGARPWSLCTAAKDKHTLDTGPVIHHCAQRKGTKTNVSIFFSFHFICHDYTFPLVENHGAQASRIKWCQRSQITWCHL